jgi:predicted nucleic acid-binding protein
MKPMNGTKVFLDTNVLVYLYSEDEPLKKDAAKKILNRHTCVVSTQVFNEISNVWFRKSGWTGDVIKQHLDNLEELCDLVSQIKRSTINRALALKDQHGLSYYDCLMLASALESGCEVLFTEDMSDGQRIGGALRIENPFKQHQTV